MMDDDLEPCKRHPFLSVISRQRSSIPDPPTWQMEHIVIHSKIQISHQDCRSNCLWASTRPQHAIGRLPDPPNPPHVTTLFGTPPWHPNRQPGSCIPTFPFFSRRPSARARRGLAAVIRPHAAGGPSGPSLEPPMVSSCSEPPRPRPRPIWRRCSFSSEICSALAGQWRGRPAPGLALPGRDWPGPGGGWMLDVGCCTYGRVCLSMPIPGSRGHRVSPRCHAASHATEQLAAEQ